MKGRKLDKEEKNAVTGELRHVIGPRNSQVVNASREFTCGNKHCQTLPYCCVRNLNKLQRRTSERTVGYQMNVPCDQSHTNHLNLKISLVDA